MKASELAKKLLKIVEESGKDFDVYVPVFYEAIGFHGATECDLVTERSRGQLMQRVEIE